MGTSLHNRLNPYHEIVIWETKGTNKDNGAQEFKYDIRPGHFGPGLEFIVFRLKAA